MWLHVFICYLTAKCIKHNSSEELFKRMHHLPLFKTSEVTAIACSWTRLDPQTDVKRKQQQNRWGRTVEILLLKDRPTTGEQAQKHHQVTICSFSFILSVTTIKLLNSSSLPQSAICKTISLNARKLLHREENWDISNSLLRLKLYTITYFTTIRSFTAIVCTISTYSIPVLLWLFIFKTFASLS